MFNIRREKRMGCIHDRADGAWKRVVVSTVLLCLFSAGCKKKAVPPAAPAAPALESVITNRLNDAAYLEALQKNREEQKGIARARYEIAQQLKVCVERVKATLPKEADEATLKEALSKDETWQKLQAQHTQTMGDIEQVLGAARQTVRQRMLEETRAAKAVAEGKAQAVDKTDGK